MRYEGPFKREIIMRDEGPVKYDITHEGKIRYNNTIDYTLEKVILHILKMHDFMLSKATIKKLTDKYYLIDKDELEYFDEIFDGLLEAGYIEETMTVNTLRRIVNAVREGQ